MTDSMAIGMEAVFTPEFERATDLEAEMQTKFNALIWPNPKVREVAASFEVMRKSLARARQMLADAGSVDGSQFHNFPQLLQGIVGPSHSGKTRAVLWTQAACAHHHGWGKGEERILYVELTPNATSRRLYGNILQALNDPAALKGTEEDLRNRVFKFLVEKGIDVVVLDEFHNLINSDTGAASNALLQNLKSLTNAGICTFAIVGLEKIIPIIRRHPEVAPRFREIIFLNPQDLTKDHDREFFFAHLDLMDSYMEDKEITEGPSGFLVGKIHPTLAQFPIRTGFFEWTNTVSQKSFPVRLQEICSKLVFAAMKFTARRVANSGNGSERKIVTGADLADAVDRWAIPNGVCKTNPWRDTGG